MFSNGTINKKARIMTIETMYSYLDVFSLIFDGRSAHMGSIQNQ